MDDVHQLIRISFRNKELSCGNVHQSHTIFFFFTMDRQQKIILFGSENLLIKSNSWCNQLCNASFYDALCHLWVFQLVTDCNTQSSTNQFGKVGIQGMVRKASQLGMGAAIISLCENNAQNLGSSHSILPKGFVKIPHTKEQDSIWIFSFDAVVLSHQWSFFLCRFCHKVKLGLREQN